MSMQRFTRLTNGCSKKLGNQGHAVALHFSHYNFCRIHKNAASHTRDGSGFGRSHLETGRTVQISCQVVFAVAALDKILLLKALGE